MKALLKFYIFSMFLLNGLSPVPVASFNFFIAAAVFPFLFAFQVPAIYNFRRENAIFSIAFIWGLLAWAFYSAPVDLGRIQGALQWLASFVVLWFGVRRWIIVSKISFAEVAQAAFYGSWALAAFVILEFFLANTRGLLLSDYIPFSIDVFPNADLFFSGIVRPRGFSAEAGFTSIVFEALIPLAIFHFRRVNILTKIGYSIMCAVAIITLYSTTTFIATAVAILFYYVIRLNRKGMVPLVVGTALVAYVISSNSEFFFSASGYKIFEFFDTLKYANAAGSRQEALAAGWTVFLTHPFGSGWGTVLQEAKSSGSEIDQMLAGTGLISLWMELLVATGFLVFFAFMANLWSTALKLARSDRFEAHLCFLSLTIVSLHHLAVYEVWFPMIWFVLGLSQVVLQASNEVPAPRPIRVAATAQVA